MKKFSKTNNSTAFCKNLHALSFRNEFGGFTRLTGSVTRWECIILNGSGLI